MKHNLVLVAKREYLRTVKKKSFWITTIIFPLFIIGVGLISGLSSMSIEQKGQEIAQSTDEVLVQDDSGYINRTLFPTYQYIDNKERGIEAVQSGRADAFIYFPADLAAAKSAEIYAQSLGLFGDFAFNDLASNMVKTSILSEISDPQKLELYNATINFTATTYEDGKVIDSSLATLIVPGISVIIYFILIQFASSYLLLSVAEEKENRMIETILSLVSPKELIWGKIIGLLGVVITQVILLILMVLGGLALLDQQLPIELLAQINITPGQIIGGIFYTVCGFLILANTMVGVGGAVPTYREAQSTSTIFILLSIFPIWFATMIIAEPSGTVAQLVSYFPFTSAMILLFRNALGELSLTETILSGMILLGYVVISFWLAYKMFEFGSLEYSNKVSLEDFIRTQFTRYKKGK